MIITQDNILFFIMFQVDVGLYSEVSKTKTEEVTLLLCVMY